MLKEEAEVSFTPQKKMLSRLRDAGRFDAKSRPVVGRDELTFEKASRSIRSPRGGIAHMTRTRLYGQGCVVRRSLSLLPVTRPAPGALKNDGHAGNEGEVFLSNYRVPRICLGFSGGAALPCLAQLGIDEVGCTPRDWRTVSTAVYISLSSRSVGTSTVLYAIA